MSSNQGFFGIFKKHREEEPEPLPFAAKSEQPEPEQPEPEQPEPEQPEPEQPEPEHLETDFRELEPELDDDADFLAATEEMSLTELESKKVKLPERKAYTSSPITMPPKISALQEKAISPAIDPETSEIKQLELRAIFGVDRELTQDEILVRASSLPGIQKVVIATGLDLSALNSLREWVSDLGFENTPVRIHVGSHPIEFIKHENVQLAVQLKSVFEPGVRETLMIVARELGRM